MVLTSLVNFFNQFDAKIFKSEKIDTHGGSLRVYIKKDKKVKLDQVLKKCLKKKKILELKNLKHIKILEKKFIKLEKMLLKILKIKKK